MSKLNCWEFKKCGREPGGSKVEDLGVCPAASCTPANGMNSGVNGGRCCYVIAGTYCGGKPQGSFASKISNCIKCDFYKKVVLEEGKDYQNSRQVLDRLAENI